MLIPQYVQPKDPADQKRWKEQALRNRLLTGRHRDDVREAIEDQFSKEIAADLEINPDLSRNPYRLIYQQLNVAYLEAPDVRVPDDEDADLSPIITPRLWSQMAQGALTALAMGESVIRLDFKWWAGAKEVSYRIVNPETVVITPMPDQPDQPGAVEELRMRDGVPCWDVWNIIGDKPVFKIEQVTEQNERVDVTDKYAPELAGGGYPYMTTDGKPILPWILKHKAVGSRLWNLDGSELSDATLKLSAYYTHWGDSFVSASHPQRWILDVETQAGHTRTIAGTPVDVVPVDRKSILKFSSKGPGGGSLGAFPTTFDPLSNIEALKQWESSLATYAGLNPGDLQVSNQAQSGYAIVVSREGQKRAAKKVEVAFRIADQELLATAAKLANFYVGAGLPEDPRAYSISYRTLKPSDQERKATAELIKAEVELGIMSKLDALRVLHPEIESDEEALERLLRVREIEQELSSVEAALAAPAVAPEAEEQVEQPEEAAPVADAPPEAPAPEVENVQLTALNGAQVQAAQGIVQGVAEGMLPRASGVQMLSLFFNLPMQSAEQIMGEVGRGFSAPIEEPTSEG